MLQELKNLLASLEQANKLAANLRERSRDIVEFLGTELGLEEEEEARKCQVLAVRKL